MRTFKIVPADAQGAWSLIAIEEDGAEVTVERYPTMGEAEAAKAALESRSLQPPA
jgi:enoyl-[acyl-carrier-protein] reductase (NADH)